MISRRQFVGGLGASLLLRPFVDLLVRPAHASLGRARRLVVFYTPNGTVHRLWRPAGGERDFRFPPGSMLEPLTPLRGDLVVLDGIDFVGVNNHEGGMAAMLTGGRGGVAQGASVDQFVAAAIGQQTRLPSLELGVQTSAWGGNVQTRMCYAPGGRFVTPEDNPHQVYKRLFGPVLGGNRAELLLLRRRSVLDLVRGEIEALRSRLGQQEQRKLDQHLEAIRATERSLGATTSCMAPPAPAERDIYAHRHFPAIGRAQTDLLVTALACGITRVASLQWAHAVSPHLFTWLGQSEGHHELSHKGDHDERGVANFVACWRWFAEQFAYLITALKDRPDPEGGTLLDRTLVVWCTELGDSRLHTCQSVPFVLAGGGLRTGRYLRYQGVPHQKLLVSICRIMGLDNTSFGQAPQGIGPLEGLV
ncbi:MAG: DUF1552 domain-containing protein [Myxococcales bacterium]|nr:DUF1552 domain-containing protein [Myxococcota bacterium]MDW8282667.1 DUF1552 domain-containing protein [Myxococcales bacterium]